MKYIHELTDNEKRELIESNDTLASMVYDDMIDGEMYFISEQMEYIRSGCNDWRIGANNYNYITVSDTERFLWGLEELQKTFCTLPDAMQPEINRVLAALNRCLYKDMSCDNYNRLSIWLDEKAQYFADCIADYFTRCLDPSRDDMISYFLDFYADERMGESCFIDDDGALYQTITKKFA